VHHYCLHLKTMYGCNILSLWLCSFRQCWSWNSVRQVLPGGLSQHHWSRWLGHHHLRPCHHPVKEGSTYLVWDVVWSCQNTIQTSYDCFVTHSYGFVSWDAFFYKTVVSCLFYCVQLGEKCPSLAVVRTAFYFSFVNVEQCPKTWLLSEQCKRYQPTLI
jgi:hypothetical protein